MKISIEKKNQLFFSPFISHYFSFSLFLFPLLSQCSQWWCNPAWWCSLAWWSHPSPWDPQHSRSLQRLTSSTQRHQSFLHHSHITLSLHHHITSFTPLYYINIIHHAQDGVTGLGGTSDPYVIIKNAAGSSCGKSQVVMKDLSPKWYELWSLPPFLFLKILSYLILFLLPHRAPFEVDAIQCGGVDAPILVQVFDWFDFFTFFEHG